MNKITSIHEEINPSLYIEGNSEKEELIIAIPKNNEEIITSTTQLETRMYNDDGRLNGNWAQMNALFNNLSLYLNEKYSNKIDPIEYLYYQYFTCKYSTIDIFDKYAHMGGYIAKNKSSFEKLFRETFNWELRGDDEDSINTSKKKSINQKDPTGNSEHINNIRTKNKELEVKKLTKKIKGEVDGFLLLDLDNKTSLDKKITYILFSFGIIKAETPEEFGKLINRYKKRNFHNEQKFGFLVIAQIIKGLITEIKPEIGNSINIQSLKKRVRENYNTYYG